MDPELMAFASSNHAYITIHCYDQTRLCILRLEVLRITYELNNFPDPNTSQRLEIKPCCVICLHNFELRTVVSSSICGHVYCEDCYSICDARNNCCGLCRQGLQIAFKYRLKFRFNARGKIVCRHCLHEITAESNQIAFRCGHVFCQTCCNEMRTHCFSCGLELGGSNQTIRLHLAFS